MLASDWVHLFHWVIYIGSFVAVGLLFTKWRRWAAVWIAALFLSQIIFHGCLIVDWENSLRIKEHLALIPEGLLTDRLSPSTLGQLIWSWLIVISATILAIL